MTNKILNKSFCIGFVCGILFIFFGLFVAYKIDIKGTEIIEDVAVDSIYTISDIYMGMTEEEFMKEMQKGCYGDLTQKQIDSIQLDVALFNHGVPDSIIKILNNLSDKQKLEEILGVPTESIHWKNIAAKNQNATNNSTGTGK